MKKNIYILILGMAAVFGLPACQDVFDNPVPVAADDGLVVEITDDNTVTRAAYSGLSSTMETGDEIGIYAWNGTTVISSNIKFTRQSDGSWTPASKVPYNASYIYCAYFPYRSDHGYTPATSGMVDTRFATFISDASNKFWVADQSTKANFTSANLCIGQGTHVGSGNRVTFSLAHKRGLAVFTDGAAVATFTGNIPYLMSDKKYFLMKPSTSTSFTDDEGTYSLSAASGKYVSHSVSLDIYIDLGLPSGTLWAKGNIISDGNGGYKIGEKTDYGAYFSWGNSVPHFCTNGSTFDDGYDFGTSNIGSPYKDTPGATIQYTTSHKGADFSPLSINDAARQLLGGNWRVPTGYEIQEMLEYTDYEYATVNGVRGGKFKKKSDNSVYIFLPFTGFYDTPSHGIAYRTGLGDYWSSSLNSDDTAFYLYFETNKACQLSNTGQRFMARGIRPVRGGGGEYTPKEVLKFDYTGDEQSVTLQPGTYTFECWGAQGGSTPYASGGKGGYSVGTLVISSSTTAYIYVGGAGNDDQGVVFESGGFNGGGNTYGNTASAYGGSGGGASDIRLGSNSLSSRVIVAGGGGGAGVYSTYYHQNGGYGGGTSGGSGGRYEYTAIGGEGGSTSAGTSYYGTTSNSSTYGTLAGLGVGGGAISGKTYYISGGGGGYYGGGYGSRSGGGGGSGYVDSSLTSASTKAGNVSFPSTTGTTETGHSGNGCVRITKND